jgi:hypothetical protein
MKRSPHTTATGTVFFGTHPFQGMNHLFQFRRQRTNIPGQFGYQLILDNVPALRNQFSAGSMHGGGRYGGWLVGWLVPSSCQKWPPTSSFFALLSQLHPVKMGRFARGSTVRVSFSFDTTGI